MAQFRGKKVIFSPQIHLYERPSVIIHFRGQSPFTLSKDALSTLSDTLYYSYDKETWYEWDGESTLSSVDNSIYIYCE